MNKHVQFKIKVSFKNDDNDNKVIIITITIIAIILVGPFYKSSILYSVLHEISHLISISIL